MSIVGHDAAALSVTQREEEREKQEREGGREWESALHTPYIVGTHFYHITYLPIALFTFRFRNIIAWAVVRSTENMGRRARTKGGGAREGENSAEGDLC